MLEFGFSLTCIFSYNYRIYDSVLVRKNTDQKKTVFQHVLRMMTLLRIMMTMPRIALQIFLLLQSCRGLVSSKYMNHVNINNVYRNSDYSRLSRYITTEINPFLANVLILYTLKTPVFRGYKMGHWLEIA